MAKLIALCDGHGMSTSGKRTPTLPNGQKSETGNFMHENEFNRAVVKYLDQHLKRCGFKTLLVAPTDADTSLKARTDLANAKGADIYISVHANANTGIFGDWTGIETYSYPGSASGKKLAETIHNEVIKGTPLKNRGTKTADFHVLRETRMPACLLELGYMDSRIDYKYLLSDAYRKECAEEIARGVCKYFGVSYKDEVKQEVQKESVKNANTGELYHVQIGAFSLKANADTLAEKLKAEGYPVYITRG